MRIGIDIVENNRIALALKNSGLPFFEKFLSPDERNEISITEANIEHVAGLWAAKEAAVKALGTGFRNGVTFHDIRICYGDLGQPYYVFYGQFKNLMLKYNLQTTTLSISHCKTHAIAVAIFY